MPSAKTGGIADPGANTQLARALILKYSISRESKDVHVSSLTL